MNTKTLHFAAALAGLATFGLFAAAPAEAAMFTNGGSSPFGGSQCMDVRGGATAAFTPVQTWACHGWLNQHFSMQGMSVYAIGSTGGAQNCLDVAYAGTTAGTTVNIYPCNGSTAQQFYYYNGKLYYPHGGLCVDSVNGANGTRLIVNYCSSSWTQQWQIK